ncbi:hypothetical protein [Aeromonas hydrophila]|uniref:hypothetical protein n=1 Tax=Aeromonas hydrophila TaxID=644 RepID=UPI003D22110B
MGEVDNNNVAPMTLDNERKAEVRLSLAVAGARALDEAELPQWTAMVSRVMDHPESLPELTKAVGGLRVSQLSQTARSVILWGVSAVCLYNFMLRDVMILLLKLENTPPPALNFEFLQRLFGGLLGF